MKLVEATPRNELLSPFIERYQYYELHEQSFIKTIPNGKIEGWVIMEGEFELYHPNSGKFVVQEGSGYYPMGNSINAYHVPEKIRCFNVKMTPLILSLPFFQKLPSNWAKMTVLDLIGGKNMSFITTGAFMTEGEIRSDLLDEVFSGSLQIEYKDEHAFELIQVILQNNKQLKTGELAEHMNMSIKTLERFTKKYFNLSPKELSQILRFEVTSSHFVKNEAGKFIDALTFGYYDQSHFIKECKRITGYAPREFFSKLRLPANDVIFE